MVDSATVSCFQCSELSTDTNNACPQSNSDYVSWKTIEGKYTATTGQFCSVIVGKSGRVYHQGGLDGESCRTQTFLEGVQRQIASKFKETSSSLKCCTNNGCNWSLSTANSNGNVDSGFTVVDLYGNTYIYYAVALSLLGLLALLFCCCCVFLLYKRYKQENEKRGNKEMGVQAANLKGMYTKQNYSDIAANKQSFGNYHSSGSNTISVAEADSWKDKWDEQSRKLPRVDQYDIHGHRTDGKSNIRLALPMQQSHLQQPISTSTTNSSGWDRKYNGVDMDWIDLKSNNYFPNMDQEAEKAARKRSRTESDVSSKANAKNLGWKPVYTKNTQTTTVKGSVNPFNFED